MRVSLENRRVLLSKNAVVTRLNVVDSPSLNHCPHHFDVVLHCCRIVALLCCAFEFIVKNRAVEPVSVINLDHSIVCVFVFG